MLPCCLARDGGSIAWRAHQNPGLLARVQPVSGVSDVDSPDVVSAAPPGGNVNKPESGTYGDVTELERLQSALPGAQPQQPNQLRPLAPMAPMPAPAQTGGLPRAIFDPSTQPDVPVSTPLAAPTPVAGTATEQRIQLLDAYARDPSFSEETRQFFARYRDRLIRG